MPQEPHDARTTIDAAATAPDEGLSLESLTEGLAKMMSAGHDPYAAIEAPSTDSAAVPVEYSREPGPEITPRCILEAMLFVGNPANEPLTSQQVASFMRGVLPSEIDELICDLNERYAADNCPYMIESRDAGYRLVLKPEFDALLDRLSGRNRAARLSQAAIEVLTLVAYNESITGEEIAKIRGRTSGAILSQLVRRQLLAVERPAERPKPVRYRTTERFLELFGLESLADLPRSEQIDQR